MKKLLCTILLIAAHHLQAMDRSGLSSVVMFRTNAQGERIAIGHLTASTSFNAARQMVSWNPETLRQWEQANNDVTKSPIVPVQEAPTLTTRTMTYVQSWINYFSSSK